jgi:enoyl-CoA hydratase
MYDFSEITYDVHERIASVTLNRPEVGNALTMTMRMELVAALRAAESDSQVNVIRIGGAGRSFCTGYDLKAPYGSRDQRAARASWATDQRLETWTDQFNRSCTADWLTLWDLLKPIVVVAHGNCLGGGLELLCMADIAFVADDARIGYPPMRAMSTPDVPVFAWKVTMARAKYLQLTGASISGVEAADWGMVVKSFPADDLVMRSDAEIRALSHIDAGLLMANKHQVNQAYELMGLRNHIGQAWSWHHLSGSVRPGHDEFFKIAKEDGMKAALRWMNSPFDDAGIR